MLSEFQFEDIIFGLFPKVGGSLSDADDPWQQNSVGDVIDMMMQALEVSVPLSSSLTHILITTFRPSHFFMT